MNYEGELRLLSETFRKCRVPVFLLESGDAADKVLDENFKLLFGDRAQLFAASFLDKIEPRNIYRVSTSFCFHYILMRLPLERILAIGPYLSFRPDQQQIFEIGEKYRIPPHRQQFLENYYGSIPLVPESSHLFSLLDTFGECLWGSNAFSVVDIAEDFLQKTDLLPTAGRGETEEILLDMKIMEERYAAENELLRAVSRGQLHKGAGILESISGQAFEKRLDDSLRNLKNYSIIMNTLLRKAAEQGGVHPLYLNEMSSSFAIRIEQLPSVAAVQDLMGEMYRSYCLLVRKHAMKDYSSPVQKAILLIDADLSADLSLSTLAAAQNISASYLSTLFKKETGKTVTAYITGERMRLATHLLETTRLQIQTIAIHCGILDVQYFSKQFKKYTGKTPKEYREGIR